jgi:beta-lactam-binding protein with PASTA domain
MSMTTRTLTRRAIELPDLVGVRADHAIQRLRELGLLPVTWSEAVEDVNAAGVVLGLDPPARSLVRPRALIVMGVAAHPDFRGHADDSLPGQVDELVEPTVPGPGVRDSSANSPAERRDDVAQLQERGVLQMELW